VKRQPNEVEGPRACRGNPAVEEFLHHGFRFLTTASNRLGTKRFVVAGHSPPVLNRGIHNSLGRGGVAMPDRKPRERVVAEITLAHLTQFASQMGRSLTPEEAMAFLNQNGRAYEMWNA
jgi:hypothetical protein